MGPIDRAVAFRGDLLRLAREARQMSQTDLAAASGVKQPHISMWESESRRPIPDDIDDLARTLEMPAEFFCQPDPILGVGIGQVFHRSQKSVSKREVERIHAWMNITIFAVRRLLRATDDWPAANMPTWSLIWDVEDEEEAARTLRAQWLVPSGPIRSVCDLLERAGVLIIPTRFSLPGFDAIGIWPSDMMPIIFVDAGTPQDRLRFSLMHEIGHHVLHDRSSLYSVSDEIESEANRFASAFLMPSEDIKQQLRSLSLASLTAMKRHWRVSMASMVHRAGQLNVVTSEQERELWRDLQRKGWRKREPVQFDVFGETPGNLYRQLIQLHREGLGMSVGDVGRLVNLLPEDVFQHLLPPESGLRVVN